MTNQELKEVIDDLHHIRSDANLALANARAARVAAQRAEKAAEEAVARLDLNIKVLADACRQAKGGVFLPDGDGGIRNAHMWLAGAGQG